MDESYPRVMGNKSVHACVLQQHLYDQMVAQSEFCDVTLIIDNHEMKAHWCVLVSCPYFQSLYDSGMEEKVQAKVSISIGKPAAVKAAISFLYLGTVEVSFSTVKDILEVADYFQIEELKKACADYLASVDVTVDNCISLSLLASLYDLDIYNRVFDYVRGHLPEVMAQPDMLTLTPDSIMALLSDKALNYVSLEDFFKFIAKWVEHDPSIRLKHFSELFCALDLTKVSKEFLEQTVEKSEFVKNSEDCQVHVLNVKMKYFTGLLKEDDGNRDVIILAGGCASGLYFHTFIQIFPLSDTVSVNNIYGYIVQEDRWTELSPLPYQMRKPMVTYDQTSNLMYVYDSGPAPDSCAFYLYKFRLLEKTWTSFRVSVPDSCADLTIQHILSCGGHLYIVASAYMQQDAAQLREWQVFLLHVNQETGDGTFKCKLFTRSIKTQVLACCVSERFICVLGWKHGNKSGAKHRNSAKFIYYDTSCGRKFDHSKGASYEPLMFPLGDELVMAKPGCYRGLKKYSFRDRKWITVKDIYIPHPVEEPSRSDYVYLTYNNQLFVFGGRSPTTKKPIETACKFNFTDRTWVKIENIPQALMNCGSCVVRVPAEHVRCHINCPHCCFHTRRSQAVYQIDYPEDEEEDEDYSYDGDDIPSDYWDEDFYDPDPYDEFWY